MGVSRIPEDSLRKIMKGNVNISGITTCVVKFYSNSCHLCHALSSYYRDISDLEEYEDVYFYAYNIDDDPDIAKKLRLNGVPSIGLFNISRGRESKPVILRDPERPNQETWYSVKDITGFINQNKKSTNKGTNDHD